MRASGTSGLQDWFNGPHRQEVVEEVVGLGRYGKTLTVLTGMEPRMRLKTTRMILTRHGMYGFGADA